MDRDYRLRNKHSGQAGMINALQATYHPSASPKDNMPKGFQPENMVHYSKPLVATNPNKDILNPLFPKESQDNPPFRKKYKLPKRPSSLWFDQAAYASYP